MSDPQEVATPSDPHSAEAEARYPDPPPPTPWDYMSPPEEVRERERDAFIAGRVSRDAEVAELKAKIAAAVARLNAASIPPMMTEAQFNATTITDARRILLGSASSPVEGDPAETRESTCVANWPECFSGGYDPRCCRFPKECSVRMVPVEGGN